MTNNALANKPHVALRECSCFTHLANLHKILVEIFGLLNCHERLSDDILVGLQSVKSKGLVVLAYKSTEYTVQGPIDIPKLTGESDPELRP